MLAVTFSPSQSSALLGRQHFAADDALNTWEKHQFLSETTKVLEVLNPKFEFKLLVAKRLLCLTPAATSN